MGKRGAWYLGCLVCLALTGAAYANHFRNAFHFDDFHTVVENPAIRQMGLPWKFFLDGRTYSALPIQQQYRPVVTASLAFDYWLGGGLESTLWFHVTTFFWLLVEGVCLVMLYRAILARAGFGVEAARWWALAGSTLYVVHPVSAETVNYITQRADLYSTLGVVASVVVYVEQPRWRRRGLYLVPSIIGALAKPPALMLPAMLATYVYLFETGEEKGPMAKGMAALRAALPALAVCAVTGAFLRWMTPSTYTLGDVDAVRYWMTQFLVCVRYVRAFFLPVWLSADTDLRLLASIWSWAALEGVLAVAGLLVTAWSFTGIKETKPIAFGLLWFLLALLPTSIPPLAEPENDHRMFFPFAGLTLSVITAAALVVRHWWGGGELAVWKKAALAGAAVVVLVSCAYGTHVRNRVWSTEETLWLDVTRKSPRNGRGLMNYGVALLGHGEAARALEYFQRAREYAPNYPLVWVNLGVAYGALGENEEAEAAFREAERMGAQDPAAHRFFAQWLYSRGRLAESESEARRAVTLAPALEGPRLLLIRICIDREEWERGRELLQETLGLFPGDAEVLELARKFPAGWGVN